MSGAAILLSLLLLGGRAVFTAARSLNAPQDGRLLPVDGHAGRLDGLVATVTGVDRRRRPLLEKTRPFVLVDGQRRSLAEALQDGHPDRLQCGLEVAGRLFLLDLEKNHDLLPKPPNVFYYLPNGTGVSLRADPVSHCYYHGSVRGFPQSRVALSTCSGLRGVIAINSTLSFELQPQEEDHHHPHHQGEEERGGGGSGGDGSGGSGGGGGDEEGLHLLFSTSPLEGDGAAGCGVSHAAVPPIHSSTHTHRRKRDILSETKYIELVLVADHQEFLNYQKNNKTIIYRMLDVANQVDWFYRPLNVRVALTGLEIWSDHNKIRVAKSPTDTLNNFLEWRTRELLPRLHHDNAQLVMGGSFDGTTVGMASQSSMCSRDRSGGVNVDHLVSVLGVASTVAHELGHNLGMSHDTAERRCSCQNEARLGGCIMEPSTGFMPGQQFSSCSAADLSVSLLHGGGMCLFNVPQPDRLLGGPRCGNLYVEKGEECDCGLLEECDDPCCNASTCQLVPGAQCSSDGICCHDCKLRAAGSVCREPLGECDLPEFCTGSSPYCPPNVFLQNGEPCEREASFCYGGVCASMQTQCQMLWGPNATTAPAVCFSSVNKQGNKYGNCGQLTNGSYIPCGTSDVHCGRIQCQGGRERPLLGTNAEILTTTVRFNHSDLVCRGTFFHLGDDVSDPATVAQGTACGPGKACLNQKCQDVSVFGVDECRRKCNGHGVSGRMTLCVSSSVNSKDYSAEVTSPPLQYTYRYNTPVPDPHICCQTDQSLVSCLLSLQTTNHKYVNVCEYKCPADGDQRKTELWVVERLQWECSDQVCPGECMSGCCAVAVFQVCNSNKNCHCDAGWAPPDCRYSGHGGSVDSGPATPGRESNPVRVALLVIFLFILPVVLLFLALRFPRFRRSLFCLGPNSPFHKARQHNRTPVMERADGRNGEQVRPLRYHLNPPTDIPLTPPHKEVHDRPAPPTKPLPPDPALKPLPQVPSKPVVPIKPLILAPPSHPHVPPHPSYTSSSKPSQHRAVAPAAGPNRRPPAPPVRPTNPQKVDSSPL
ncbi:disintegrin and metalloproteinase domain-containing protein 15 isoform X2 [Chelmon rostratus]|uniref:disintegrin and metalloproteinase domain-containing protein 15 isoform X2 n=1 Tax=Chelmon rostratus TaxID=109905 RepID=UPI001BEA3160|nr:disintegrin and metalloproteinase domain-containing protein 15 isoform X2 [Chelmon rostratus]